MSTAFTIVNHGPNPIEVFVQDRKGEKSYGETLNPHQSALEHVDLAGREICVEEIVVADNADA